MDSSATGITADDFADNAFINTVVIQNNAATFTKTIATDAGVETENTFNIKIRTGSGTGTVVYSMTNSIKITDKSPTILWFTGRTSTVYHGDSATLQLTTKDIPDGTSFDYRIDDTFGVSSFTDGLKQGSFTIQNNQGSFTKTVAGSSTDSQSKVTVWQTAKPELTVWTTVKWEGNSRAEKYTITANTTSIAETGTVTFTMNTVNVPNGTVFGWKDTHFGYRHVPVTSSYAYGNTFTVNNNTATITVNITPGAAGIQIARYFMINVMKSPWSFVSEAVAGSAIVEIRADAIPA